MPMVSGGLEDIVAQLIQLSAMTNRRKEQQAQNTLALAKPGQTLAELFGNDQKSIRRTFGRDMPGTTVVQEPTLDYTLDKFANELINRAKTPEGAASIDAAPNDLLTGIAATRIAQKLGTPGQTTPTGLKAAQQTGETKAKTEKTASDSIFGLVIEGVQGWAKASADTRRAAGQVLMGTGTEESQETARQQQILQGMTIKEAIKFTANPKGHVWGKQLASMGIDPTAAVAAAGTGMLSLLDNIAMINAQSRTSAIRVNEAMQTQVAKWAGQLSEATGGALRPDVVNSIMQRRLQGLPRLRGEKGGEHPAENLLDTAIDLARNAAIASAIEKGNPEVSQLQALFEAARQGKIPQDQMQRYSDLLQQKTAEIMVTQRLGLRPPQTDTAGTKAWDATLDTYKKLGPKVTGPGFLEGLKAIFGAGRIDVPGVTGQRGEVQLPAGQQLPTPVPTPKPNEVTPAAPPVSLTPEQQQAVQQALAALGMQSQ